MLDLLGDKTAARRLAQKAGIPVVPGTEEPVTDPKQAEKTAAEIGFPLIIKAAFGGGGRGMRVVDKPAEFAGKLEEARREAAAAFGNDAVFMERFVRRARHIEVQILGDRHGHILHLYERDCSVQRRHQKVVEVAPAVSLDPAIRAALAEAAVKLARTAGYYNAGTVEFLVDADSGEWYFIEVNPRIQVEHTVTEMVTGIDLVRAQIQVAQGLSLHGEQMKLPAQEKIPLYGYAMQCRITTEDPANNFVPDYGKLSTYRSPAGFGIRLDGGSAYGGAVITPVLRLSAGEGHGLGQRLPAGLPAHGPQPARVPRARREDQHPFPGKRGQQRGVPGRPGHHPLDRGDPGALPLRPQTRPCHPPARLSWRCDRERQSGGGGQAAPQAARIPRRCRRTSPPLRPRERASFCNASARKVWPNGRVRRSGCCSPTPRFAMPTSRCWPPASAPTT